MQQQPQTTKAAKKLKRPVLSQPPIRKNDKIWAKSDKEKAKLFAKDLKDTFVPNIFKGDTKKWRKF